MDRHPTTNGFHIQLVVAYRLNSENILLELFIFWPGSKVFTQDIFMLTNPIFLVYPVNAHDRYM